MSEPVQDAGLKRLQEAFPDHKIGLANVTDLKDFTPRLVITVDDHKLKATWNRENIQFLVACHGLSVEDEIIRCMIEEIQRNLDNKCSPS